jgi:hypothetical protein
MKDNKAKRLTFTITPEDEKLFMKYQIMKLDEGEEKPSYNDIVNEVANFNIEKLRSLLTEIVEKNK